MGKLSFLIHPNSVAVVGASYFEGKVGNSIMKNIINSGYKGKLFPINPKPGSIYDHPCHKSVLDVKDDIDSAILCLPAAYTAGAAEECGKKGIKGIVIVSAGFKEIGGKGIELENQISEICKKYNMRCVGPNVLGVISTSINMSFAAKTPLKGKIAMFSQSGAMMTAVIDWSISEKIGFSNFISIGNKMDLDEVDFIEEISDDPETSTMILYLESVNDGKKFMKTVSESTKKKPVIILKAGTSAAGSAAASSHTGALAGNDNTLDLAFEKAGVIRAKSMNELFDIASCFDKIHKPGGDFFAIVTNAGGPGILATDSFSQHNIKFSKFSTGVIDKLKEILPPEASVKNPIDIVGDAQPKRFLSTLETIFQDPIEICAGAIVLVTPQSTTNPKLVSEYLIQIKKTFPDRVLVTAFMGGESMEIPRRLLESESIPCFPFPEPAIRALDKILKYKNLSQRPRLQDKEFTFDTKFISNIIQQAKADNRKVLYPFECAKILSSIGVNHIKTKAVSSAQEAFDSFKEISAPAVMKIISPEIVHKTDVGGVKFNIKTPEEAKAAYLEIMESVQKKCSNEVRIYGCEIQSMITENSSSKGREIIFGMTRDPQWGPLLMFGTGGIYANFIKDVDFQLATDYTEERAYEQLKKTKISSILKGVRGETPSDIPALINVMKRMAQFSIDFLEVREFDINPLLVFSEGQGVCAVDVKIMI